MSEIVINLVFEDNLSGAVLRKLLVSSEQGYTIGLFYNTGGFGWIKRRIEGLNNAAKGMPYLILTDLDRYECPPILLREWHIENHSHNLLFNVAVRQVESWILACRRRFAEFIGVQECLIPTAVDEIPDAKRFLIDLARRSRKKQLREDIVPKDGSTARIGADYNGRLTQFVESRWDPNIAKKLSPSLCRTMESLDVFQPVLQDPV